MTLPIPDDPTLAGAMFYTQGFALDPSANALGMITTNAGAARVGVR